MSGSPEPPANGGSRGIYRKRWAGLQGRGRLTGQSTRERMGASSPFVSAPTPLASIVPETLQSTVRLEQGMYKNFLTGRPSLPTWREPKHAHHLH